MLVYRCCILIVVSVSVLFLWRGEMTWTRIHSCNAKVNHFSRVCLSKDEHLFSLPFSFTTHTVWHNGLDGQTDDLCEG
jgi:hypothetical protein